MAEKPKYPSDDADRFQLRMPHGMRDDIARRAKAAGRSMNAEIVYRLKGWLDHEEDTEAFLKEAEHYPENYGQLTLEEIENLVQQNAELRGESDPSKLDEQELSKQGPDDVIAAVVRLTESRTEAILTEKLRKLVEETIEDVLNRHEVKRL